LRSISTRSRIKKLKFQISSPSSFCNRAENGTSFESKIASTYSQVCEWVSRTSKGLTPCAGSAAPGVWTFPDADENFIEAYTGGRRGPGGPGAWCRSFGAGV
jgi:hypothetical protein